MKKIIKKEEYTAKDIYVLKGLEPVRKRPGMYIGSTGASGIHHLIWECVDNSVTYDTPVIIKEREKIKIKKIGEIIDENFRKNHYSVEKSIKGEAEILRGNLETKTLTFDPHTLKLSFQPIFSLIRHKVNSEIYKITLQNGRQVEITPYHSLFTLKDGRVLPIKGAELEKGSSVIVPKVWPEIKNQIKEIDLIEELLKLSSKKTESIYLYNIKNLLGKDIYRSLKSNLRGKANSTSTQHPSNIFYDYKRYDYLPFNLLRELKEKDVAKIKEQALIGTRWNPKIRLNPRLKIDRFLIEILGIFTAEGCIVKNHNIPNRVVFGLGAHEKDLINYICFLAQKVFGSEVKPHYVHETARTIAIDSYLIALIFKEIFKTGKNSSNKKVPDLIFNLNSKLRERYLIGYLAGDGYPTKIFIKHLINNTTPSPLERRKFNATAKNRDFIITLSYLLSSLNKSYSYGERKTKSGKKFIEINYKGTKKKWEIKSQRLSFALDFYWNTNSSYFNYLPFDEIIGECYDRPTINRRNNGGEGISSNKVLTLLESKRIVLKTEALKFLNSDLGILKIRKIEKIKYSHPWVYDISVPNGENFIGGSSPICCHNSLDEAMAGHCKHIQIYLLPDNKIRTVDDGRGIPVDKHPQTGKSALETVMTTLHAGAKFGGKAYQIAGGLHGVGVSVVCALSKYMKAEVCRGSERYVQEYSKGKPKTKVRKLGACKRRGTTITFEPDATIFEEVKFDIKKILNHIRQQAYLTPGIKITVYDQRNSSDSLVYNFYFEGGLRSYVKYLVGVAETRNNNIFYVKNEKEGTLVEVALQYAQEMEALEQSFANNIFTGEGGSHLTGFRTALTRVLNDYARKNGYLKEKEENFTGNDVREGLVGVVSVKIKEPQFEGQTKAKLGNPEVKSAVEQVLSEGLTDFLERNPQDARAIIENSLISAKARRAAKAARNTVLRKGVLNGLSLPGKLADCSSSKPEESEIYIVEGDSAGGCFSGDTKVALIDGRNLSFKQLIKEEKENKKNYCYTVKKDEIIGVGLIENVRRTKKNTEVIKVILDNDEEIICTPDHKFMLRNGFYKEAQNLFSQDSLMPLYRKISQIGKSITISPRFFNGNERKLKDAVLNYNHKVKKIVKISKKMDVYDLEVEGTHNFALASGVFVHNSCKMARDRRFQAILPLKGKILNVERARLDRILTSEEIKALIIALGAAISQDFDIEKLRYHRIILMSDADVDGAHIRTLLLTLFFRYFREIIEKGYLYIAQPPLYKIQFGKNIEYAYTDADKEEILSSFKKEKAVNINIQRYKGLGEMNPDELWNTTMDPKNRILLKVEIEDAKEADHIFDVLMGKEVLPRKKFIQVHAKKVKNLDI